VGMGLNPPRYIASGDVIRVEIDGIGQIENRFVWCLTRDTHTRQGDTA
jgi:2-keto-4-pentenoate hydratase/2-oxohepta-3-ene-1,7-dioic acid hydratase in catechol pathway